MAVGLTRRPLRICIMGSAESPHVLTRAHVFAEMGHSVTLLSPVACDPVLAPLAAGLELVVCGNGSAKRIALAIATWRALRRDRYDLYHAHYAAEYGTWIAALSGREPLVISVMGGDVLFDEQGSLGPLGRALTRNALRVAAAITVKSPHLARTVEALGCARDKILEIVWGVDTRRFHPGAAAEAPWPNMPPGARVLFSPRMLRPFYNQQVMVEALAELATELPDVHLVLSTFREDRDYHDQLRALAASLGIADRVHAVPAADEAGMVRLYASADAVLSLAESDGFPQTILESMACGTPVICRALDRYRPLLENGRNAVFVGPSAAEVAQGVRRLLLDAAFHRRLSDAGIETVRRNGSLEAQARTVEDLYFRLVEGRHLPESIGGQA